ncbi:hypothetical protein [Bacillus multifaciens]|uniref:hypothetical protein n=1 Tax=Bacillus multifaciens TaxID=3068506 RepID=UPI0027410C10|nr:hypothetical protein [Bacillus sp. WLY-B-L8]MDP7978672.1 hypothetical protein [Bacillus sp. WLY-B-L8]HDX9587979.1 hypothetical protein [Bacillus pseudomycoides]
MKRRRVVFFTCIVIVIFGIGIAAYNKISRENNLDCRASAVQIKAVLVDYKGQPLSDVQVYEASISNKERAVTNSQGEFQFYSGVCGNITLLFVTLDGNTYTKIFEREDVPNIIKLE